MKTKEEIKKREIKFRAWDQITKEMRFPVKDLHYVQDEEGLHIYDTEVDDWQELCDEHDTIYMQYTGLKDKNGKEIYEGDIIIQQPDDHNKWAVTFDPHWKAWTYYLDGKMNSYIFNEHYHEVIGNIYEHPELKKSN